MNFMNYFAWWLLPMFLCNLYALWTLYNSWSWWRKRKKFSEYTDLLDRLWEQEYLRFLHAAAACDQDVIEDCRKNLLALIHKRQSVLNDYVGKKK